MGHCSPAGPRAAALARWAPAALLLALLATHSARAQAGGNGPRAQGKGGRGLRQAGACPGGPLWLAV